MSQPPNESFVPNDPSAQSPQVEQAPAPKPKKKHRLLKVLAVLIVLIVVLVLCAPWIASTAPVRGIVVSQINNNLAGSVAIDDYSLGWSGFRASGIKVYDDQKNLVAEITKLVAPVSLLRAARGNIDLGDTQITAEKIDFRVFPDGTTSADHIAKASPPDTSPKPATGDRKSSPDQPIDLPNVKGRVTINLVSGKVSGEGVPAPIAIEPSTIALNIPDINQPISNDIKLAYRVGDSKTSTISVIGTVDAVDNGKLDPSKIKDTLKAQQKIAMQDVDLGAAGAFVKDAQIGGIANGTLDANVRGITGISASGEIVATNASYAGSALKGNDRLVLDRVSIPIQVTRTQIDANNALIKIEKLSVDSPLLKLNVVGQVAEAALKNLANKQKPGAQGQIQIDLSVPDFGAVAKALPNTLKLQEGVTIEKGSLTNSQTISITADSVAIMQKLDVAAEGKRNQQRITLSPVHLETAATVVPNGKDIPDVSKLNLALTSAFATITGGGDSLAKIGIDGKFDLAKLQSELAQFVDLGGKQFAGTGQFKVETNGDVTNNAAPIGASLSANLANVRVVGVADQPIDLARAVLNAGGQLQRDANGKPIMVDNGTVAFQSGDEKSPLVDVVANANIGLGDTITAPSFKLAKFAVNDLNKVQQQYGALVPALKAQEINLKSGAIYANVAGSFDGKTITLGEPLAFSMPNIQIDKGGRQLLSREDITGRIAGTVSMGDTIAANLSELSVGAKNGLFNVSAAQPLSVTLAKSGGVAGNGALKVGADIARLSGIAQAFGSNVEATNSAGRITSGTLDGTIKLAQAQDTAINFDGKVLNLTLHANGQQAIKNETVTITLDATATKDMKGVNVKSANVASTFANVKVSDAQLVLGGAPLEMITKAVIDVDVPNLPAVYGLMNAFAPPTASPQAAANQVDQPIAPPTFLLAMQRERKRDAKLAQEAVANTEPIAITSGSARMKLTVDRPGGATATNVHLSEMKVSKLAVARGNGKPYTFEKDVDLKLAATVASKGEAIESVSVNELAGDLGGVATIAMPEKLTVTSPQDKPQANGAIKLDGTIDALVPLLAVMQGAPQPLPYSGQYSLVQKIATVQTKDGLVLNIEGTMSAPQFRMMENGKPAFEDAIEVKNNLGAYLDTKTATIRTLNITMPRSNALALNVGGRVIDWERNRTIRDAKIDLTYDLATLWKIVFPMLSPEMREQYSAMKVAGKRTTTFNVGGAFPNRATVYESFKSLNADGGVGLELLDLPQGVTTQVVDVPFKMTGGVLVIEKGKVGERPPTPEDSTDGKANGPGLAGLLGGGGGDARRQAAGDERISRDAPRGKAPAELKPENGYANTGALNLAGITVDLTTPDLNVTIPKDKMLLQQVRLNPVLADSLGKIGAVLFVGSSKAEGLINLRVADFNRVPIGDLTSRDRHANATLVLNVEDVKLSGVVTAVLAQALGADAITGRIPDSTITIANGQAKTDLTVQIDKEVEDPKTGKRVMQGQPMKFNGAVTLADLRLNNFVVDIAPGLLIRDLRKYAPNGAVLPLKGFASKPELDIQKFIAENAIKGLIPGADKSGDGSGDGLGGLLDKLGGGGKKDDPGDKKKKR